MFINNQWTSISQKAVTHVIPWNRSHVKKLTGLQKVNKFPKFQSTRIFCSVFIINPPAVPIPRQNKFILFHPIKFILDLYYYYPLSNLDLQIGFIPQVSPLKHCVHLCTFFIRSATCPDSRIHLDMITRKILRGKYQSWRSSSRSFLQSPVTPVTSYSDHQHSAYFLPLIRENNSYTHVN